MVQPSIAPRAVDEILYGSGTNRAEFFLSGFTGLAQVSASISTTGNQGIDLRIVSLSVTRQVAVTTFLDVIPGEVPAHHEHETETQPVVTYENEVISTVQGGGPISVGRSEGLKITIAATVSGFEFTRGTGVLTVTSGSFENPIAVPLLYQAGTMVDFTLAPDRLSEEQGKTVTATIAAFHRAGSDADVTYELKGDAESTGVTMEPGVLSLRLRPGEATSATVTFRINRECSAEQHLLTVVQRGAFPADGRHGHSLWLDVRPAPPPPPQPTLTLAGARDSIHQDYLRLGGSSGPLGFPISPVTMSPFGGLATRLYRGGRIEVTLGDGPSGMLTKPIIRYSVVITLLGIRCVREADHDQMTPTDEPYFIMSLDNVTGAPIVKKLGPFPNVETGTEIGTMQPFRFDNLTPNPMSIRVVAYENDQGDPGTTADNLQAKFVELAQAVQSLAAADAASAADGPGIGPAVGAGAVGAFAGPLGALLAVAIVELLGLDDDYIGQGAELLFARTDDLGTEDPPRKGSFQGKDYNAVIDINGGGEGHYQLFFDIDPRITPEES
jgi:hypothetical protein